MVKMINLFNLHSQKDTPNGWIWVTLKISLIKKIYSSLTKKLTQRDIANIIRKKLNAGLSTVEKHLVNIKKSKKHIDVPLSIVIELNNLSKKDYTEGLLNSIINLTCKNYNSQSVKPIRNINDTMAKIIGAHIADGYLQLYKDNLAWKVTEGKKDLIDKLAIWIKDAFGIKPVVWYYSKNNMWVCSTKNKVFCRFLEKIVGLPLGEKSYTIREPKIIKTSNIHIRNAFLAGMLNFDGCVKISAIISLTSMSKELIMDVKEILDKNKIKTNIVYNKNKKSWIIETSKSRDKSTLIKLLNFFEKDTYKYNRLKFFIDEDIQYSMKDLSLIFPKERLGKTSIDKVYNSVKELRKFNAIELAKSCQISKTTLYKYLYVLEKANLLGREYKQITTPKNAYKEAIYFLKEK